MLADAERSGFRDDGPLFLPYLNGEAAEGGGRRLQTFRRANAAQRRAS